MKTKVTIIRHNRTIRDNIPFGRDSTRAGILSPWISQMSRSNPGFLKTKLRVYNGNVFQYLKFSM